MKRAFSDISGTKSFTSKNGDTEASECITSDPPMPTQQLASSQISTQYRNRPIYRIPVAPYQFQARGPERFGAVRMGPPYLNGMNISLNPPIPAPPRQKGPFSCQVTNRHRLFGPGPFISPPERFVSAVISLDESSSSSSESSNNSSDDETDASSVLLSEKETEVSKPAEVETRSDVKAAMKTGPSRAEPPVITISDDDSDGSYENSAWPNKSKQKVRKAMLSADGKTIKNTNVKRDEAMAILNMLGKSDEKEDNVDILLYGMSMINQDELKKKLITVVGEKEKPKRVNAKGLYSHVRHGNLVKVLAFLNVGANPLGVVRSEEGRTSLHIAAAKGLLEILLMLIYKAGPGKVDCFDSKCRTPLFLAVEKKHLNVSQFLVKAGANVHLKNSENMNLLHVAARRGSELMVRWLIKMGVSVNDQDAFGYSPLMWAAEYDCNRNIVQLLMKNGADITLLDNEMNVCLHWAAIAGSFECTRELVSGSLDAQVNARNKFGETPLHVAAKRDHYHVTQYLLLHGADYQIKNKLNSTPLEVCPAGSKTFYCIRLRKEVGEPRKVPYYYISDISRGKERIPVSCLNEVDLDQYSNDFVYIVRPEASPLVTIKQGLATIKPCKCEDSCGKDCKCIKLCEKQKLWYTEDGKLDLALLEEDSPVLFECTPLCSCWSYCPNRLVQRGIQFPLQVFKTRMKGWGLRTLTDIPQGAFILSYVGELITDEEAERRNADTYLFNLDLKTTGDEPNCMDAWRYGNCGRFINHACNANMRAVKLFTGHRDISFPEVAFFACRDIDAKEELCFDYGDSFWNVKNESGMYCKCQWEHCSYGRPR